MGLAPCLLYIGSNLTLLVMCVVDDTRFVGRGGLLQHVTTLLHGQGDEILDN